jgi:hypothetical protein
MAKQWCISAMVTQITIIGIPVSSCKHCGFLGKRLKRAPWKWLQQELIRQNVLLKFSRSPYNPKDSAAGDEYPFFVGWGTLSSPSSPPALNRMYPLDSKNGLSVSQGIHHAGLECRLKGSMFFQAIGSMREWTRYHDGYPQRPWCKPEFPDSSPDYKWKGQK